MNPDKFRISVLPWMSFFNASAYDSKQPIVGAFDAVLSSSAQSKTRSASYFQVAAIAPETKKAVVS